MASSSNKYFRAPQTMNEQRAWGKFKFETKDTGYKVRTSLRRSPHLLPDSYWDISRPYNEKNWKHYRKTQYKIKA